MAAMKAKKKAKKAELCDCGCGGTVPVEVETVPYRILNLCEIEVGQWVTTLSDTFIDGHPLEVIAVSAPYVILYDHETARPTRRNMLLTTFITLTQEYVNAVIDYCRVVDAE